MISTGLPSAVCNMDSQLDIAGAFVLKEVKRKPGRKVAAQNLETTTSLQKEEAKKMLFLM